MMGETESEAERKISREGELLNLGAIYVELKFFVQEKNG